MGRAFEQYSEETKDLRRVSFSLCGGMKSGDIQILLESYNFSEKGESHMAGVEFQWPCSVGKPPYRTYEILGKFIQNDIQFLNKNKKKCDYTKQTKTSSIKGDFKKGTCYLQISNTQDDIINLFVKGGGIMNDPVAIADSELSFDLVTEKTLTTYTGEKKNTILVTQEDIFWMFLLMDAMDKDIEKYGERFKAII